MRSHRRWCLTGTPIQNRLEDLAALLRFLKIEPFEGRSAMSAFRQNIVDPLYKNYEDPCKGLRTLLQSMCLRRTLQNHSKLRATYTMVSLRMTTTEELQYHRTLQQAKSDIDVLVSTGQRGQKFKLFTLLLRLRMLCNHGTYYNDSSQLWMASNPGMLSRVGRVHFTCQNECLASPRTPGCRLMRFKKGY